MEKVRFVGLDVHADSIAIAVAEPGRGEPAVVAAIPNDVTILLKMLRRLGRVKCCYEAGPTGFGLQRTLAKAGIECTVVAPSLVPTRAGDRVKTDRRDAVKLARFLRSGDLTEVHVPDAATEAMRDLERARDDAKKAERVARHQLSKFLLRHGRRRSGKSSWTKEHLEWIRQQRFEHEAQQRVLEDYLRMVEDLAERTERLTKSIVELIETWSLKPLVTALQALRGISMLSAVTLAAEIGDFGRFQTAPEFMSYTGLVPSEQSSGGARYRGRITHSGNTHVRRTLVESAWAYRFRPRMSEEIRRRSKASSEEVLRVAWRAQTRLCARFRRLAAAGKPNNKVVVAIARELAGFVWAIAREPHLAAASRGLVPGPAHHWTRPAPRPGPVMSRSGLYVWLPCSGGQGDGRAELRSDGGSD
jgi:transposase